MPSLKEQRTRFSNEVAPELARQIGISTPRLNKPTALAAYFKDDERFVVAIGKLRRAKKGDSDPNADVQKCLARGLGVRKGRQLVLLLPEGHTFATLHRSAWLSWDASPTIHTHRDGRVNPEPAPIPAPASTMRAYADRLPATDLADDFAKSLTPTHLGSDSQAVYDLVEWATTNQQLDAGHRRGVRSWHCMGQMVLSLKREKGQVLVRAGIHYGGSKAPEPLAVSRREPLLPQQLEEVQRKVQRGIEARLSGSMKKDDEAWLQSVLRRDPSLVGIEQPALREVPAWRPRDLPEAWSRGRIDLVGLDGHGNVRLAETKLSSNKDEMLVLQGLDYFIWANAYAAPLLKRLGAPAKARMEVHYVVGATPEGDVHLHPHVRDQIAALSDQIPWRFQVVRGWYRGPNDRQEVESELLPVGVVP